MISQFDVINIMRNNVIDARCKLDATEENIVTVDTGELVSTVADFANNLRKLMHCDFEVIYDEHASLTVVYRCRECGTVIFGGDDEDRYDHDLACPTCGGYETHLKYWTKAEIDADVEKQKTIRFYVRAMADMKAQAKRRNERGLNDWEIYKKSIDTQNGQIRFALECLNLFQTGLQGLCCKITVYAKDEGGFMAKDKEIFIPLSWMALKSWLYRRKLQKENKSVEV